MLGAVRQIDSEHVAYARGIPRGSGRGERPASCSAPSLVLGVAHMGSQRLVDNGRQRTGRRSIDHGHVCRVDRDSHDVPADARGASQAMVALLPIVNGTLRAES